jgi:hypothetical protein
MQAGRHFESRLFLDVGVDMARRSGSPTEQGRALMYLGVSVMEDDPRAALNAMLECAELTGRAGVRPMQGMALANSSEGAVDIGEWDVADRTLAELALLTREASADDDGAAMTKAMLMAHRGDPSAALAALADLESRRGHGWDVVGMRTWFLRAQAVCLFLAGDSSAAAETALISIDLDPAGSNAPTSLWIAVQAASALREGAKIRTALEATATLRGHWTALIRDTAAAAVACLEGSDGAGPTMAEALDAWSGADLPLDHASATLCALGVLPAADIPAGHVERARTYLSGLRATSMLRLYDAVST